ncbi:MAG: hypothetical protein DWQ31_12505 [Planctomycetota bacterium]|nr:MAG: hypothetical protein DWQ31_12505 [Planctomycetota bacterium]REJ89297.1 MAG: hypothetical protein DWQ35_18345 [Planctomycetota bacterium]REK22872.1 MAG: hypothetical protein DWQ42_16310 [Planctomycetota bacterium]REK37428.1 MAG: hypothetical protein DWQ46_22365 [Planctomycetota bacterium]
MARKVSDKHVAAWAGFDLSTTGLGVGVRSAAGAEDYAHLAVRGATKWKGEPAFELEHVPGMILAVLKKLERAGWAFEKTAVSFAVRQHDMALLDKTQSPLMPALSWQCNAASSEVAQLRTLGAEATVGRIEERFILPKLIWVLKKAPALRSRLKHVMTTGDWIALCLTGRARLSTSDAISNGLLLQASKRLAADVMRKAKLRPEWFPDVLQSGKAVGRVSSRVDLGGDDWAKVRALLAGSQVVAGLGDNHATGVGCGLDEQDTATMVVSAGTSGTINRVCRPAAQLAGEAACFEYYRSRLLLMMLADCCNWYDRFVAKFAAKYKSRLGELNDLAAAADLGRVQRVLHSGGKETYAPAWNKLSLGEKVASTQFSIMLELLLLIKAMQHEVAGGEHDVQRFVLTGGLSQSKFFQQVFCAGVRLLEPRARVELSARKGPLRYQTAAYGALLNAMRPSDPHAAEELCPVRACAAPRGGDLKQLQYRLRACGL